MCCRGGNGVVEEESRLSIAYAIEKIFLWGRDQERVGEWKCMPRTMPDVVGPKDLSNLGHGAASLTLSSSHTDK
jgi:hypothetical protein